MGHISNYSEQTASEIDEEIQAIMSTAYERTREILEEHMDELHRLAGVLYEREKLDEEDFKQVMGGELLPKPETLPALEAVGREPEPKAELPEEAGAEPEESDAQRDAVQERKT